jgi:hypothetical protein
VQPRGTRRDFIGGLAAGAGVHLGAAAGRAEAAPPPVGPAGVFDITKYGARSLGAPAAAAGGAKKKPGAAAAAATSTRARAGELATVAIQKAIDACAAAGGGMVLIPPGRYVSGALFLKSNIHLHISAGATLVASDRAEDFPPINGRWEGIERKTHSSLLTGVELDNVTIGGRGTLDGQGSAWWQAHDATRKLRLERGLGREADNPPDAPLKWPRPRVINLIRCQGVLVDDLVIHDSPSWTIHLVYCHDVVVDGVTMSGLQAQDCCGVIIDSSKQVRVANCSIASGADCIGLKSGYNEDGRRVGLPCEDVVITNCNLSFSYASAIAIGSETAGGIKNVAISNCIVTRCNNGISIRSTRGRGGVVERVRVSNVVMDGLRRYGINIVQFFDSVRQSLVFPGDPPPQAPTPETNRAISVPVNEGTPTFRDLEFTAISIGEVPDVANIEGLPERFISGIRFQDVIVARAKGGITCSRVADLSISGLRLDPTEKPAVDARDARRLEIDRLRAMRTVAGKSPLVRLANVAGAFIHGCDVTPGPGGFVATDTGNPSREVNVAGNNVIT